MKKQTAATFVSLAEEIKEKTGFILEHQVATFLEQHGWGVIHNRFYIDDVQAIQREMDLLVYKVDEVDEVKVYTALIISCKKSAFKDWIFLTRNAHSTKYNLDTAPFTFWSNSEILNYQIKGKKFNELQDCDEQIKKDLITKFEYSKTVFAFREFDGKGEVKKLGQDSAIFESIITLIKSQAYELESLPLRRQEQKYYYNINLLTVADVGKFIELECEGEKFEEKEIDRINYVNRFLVNKKEYNSRIVITKVSALVQVIEDFDNLHKLNTGLVGNGIKRFYEKEIWEDYRAKRIVMGGVEEDLLYYLKREIREHFELNNDQASYPYVYMNNEGVVELQFYVSQDIIDFMNQDEECLRIATKWLEEKLRYTGKFKFEIDELPF